MQHQIAKEAAAKKALEFVRQGSVIGLGTGTSAACFIRQLGEKCRAGFQIQGVATSEQSEQLAQNEGIPLIPIDERMSIDLTVDGADQIDRMKRMIKGGGGALLREKIVAAMSLSYITVVDESKVVNSFSRCILPLEIAKFGASSTLCHIAAFGLQEKVRMKEGSPYVTDNDNYIVDVLLPEEAFDVEVLAAKLRAIPGVLETGLFINLAKQVIVGNEDGSALIWSDEKLIQH